MVKSGLSELQFRHFLVSHISSKPCPAVTALAALMNGESDE